MCRGRTHVFYALFQCVAVKLLAKTFHQFAERIFRFLAD